MRLHGGASTAHCLVEVVWRQFPACSCCLRPRTPGSSAAITTGAHLPFHSASDGGSLCPPDRSARPCRCRRYQALNKPPPSTPTARQSRVSSVQRRRRTTIGRVRVNAPGRWLVVLRDNRWQQRRRHGRLRAGTRQGELPVVWSIDAQWTGRRLGPVIPTRIFWHPLPGNTIRRRENSVITLGNGAMLVT